MKYTVEGFNQKALIELKLTLEETLLLRWFIDFQGMGKMKAISNEGKVFYWVNYQSAADDLPIIASNKYKITRLFENMVDKGLFERFTYRVGGVYSTFRIIPDTYISLIEDIPSSNSARRVQADLLEPSSETARTNNPSTNQSISNQCDSKPKRPKKVKKEAESKGEYKPYGENNKVFFFDSEYKKLVEVNGENVVLAAIDIVDAYLVKYPSKSYTDFVRVLNTWALEEAEKKVKQSFFQNSSSSIRTSTAPAPEIICCGEKYNWNLGFCRHCGKKYNEEGKVV